MKLSFNRIFLAVIFTILPIFILANSIAIKVDVLDMALITMLILGIIVAAYIRDKRVIIGLIIASVILLFFLIDFEMIGKGASNLIKRYNSFSKAYNAGKDLELVPQKYEGIKYLVRCYLFVMLPCLYVVYSNKFWKMVYLNVTIPFYVLCFAIGKVPSTIEIVLMTVAYADLMVYHKGGDKRIHLNSFLNEAVSKIVPIVLAIVIVSIALLNDNVHPYERDPKLDEMKENINDYISGKKEFSLLELLGLDDSAYGGISRGELGNASELKFKNIDTLKIELSSFSGLAQVQNLYIKGYVAGDYNKNLWSVNEDIEEELNEIVIQYGVSEDVLENITYYVLEQCNKASAEHAFDFQVKEQNLLSVEDLQNQGYDFYPFCSRDVSDLDIYGDYQYTFMMVDRPLYDYRLGELRQEYIDRDIFDGYEEYFSDITDVYILKKMLADYSEVVYDYYLDVPDSFADSETGKEILQYKNVLENEYYTELPYYNDLEESYYFEETRLPDFYDWCINYVKEYLDLRCEYTLKPGKLEKGKDFVDVFLNESHKGYCSHFASAAVLMFRQFGIPARYVEGYAVSKLSFRNDNGNLKATAKDSDAHAWVEIFVDDLGWIIVDPTPSNYRKVIDGKEKNTTYPVETTRQYETSQVETTTKKETTSQEETTTKKETTSINEKDNTTAGSGNGGSSDENGGGGNKINIPLLILLGLIVIVGGFVVILQCRAMNKQKKASALAKSDNYPEIVKMVLYELSYFMKQNGFELDYYDSTKDLAKKIQLLCEVIDDNTDELVAKAIYKMKYSDEPVNAKEIEIVLDKMKVIASDQYKKSNILRKISIYYFKCLYLFDK